MNNKSVSWRIFNRQQNLIILLFVSGALIFLDLGLFSASFLVGAALIFYTLVKSPSALRARGNMWLLFFFLFIALLSLLNSEIAISLKHLKIYLQTVYWFLLSVIIYNLYPYLDKLKLSKFILFSVLFLLVLYVTGFQVGSQNGVAYTGIILAPLGYFYIKKLSYKIFFSALILFLMILNGSRTGAVIAFLQFGFIVLLLMPGLNRYFKSILLSTALVFLLVFNESGLATAGRIIYPLNERVGVLLMDTDYVMHNDMSWLQRKAQVQKGKQIFNKHPFLGIGYTNFVDYKILINESAIESDRKLRNIDNRSAHNSYVALLAETGLLGLSSIVLLLLLSFVTFWKNLKLILNSFEAYVFVSLVGLIIYFYTISGHQGTSVWIMYGMIAGAAQFIKKSKLVQK